jgi:sRNA-binding regulator protein Hfq
LGSPYLYDKKVIFYREENKYHITKDEIAYTVRTHRVKTNLFLVTTRQMKRLVNASKNFVLMIVKAKDDDKSKAFKECDPKHRNELVKIISNYNEVF